MISHPPETDLRDCKGCGQPTPPTQFGTLTLRRYCQACLDRIGSAVEEDPGLFRLARGIARHEPTQPDGKARCDATRMEIATERAALSPRHQTARWPKGGWSVNSNEGQPLVEDRLGDLYDLSEPRHAADMLNDECEEGYLNGARAIATCFGFGIDTRTIVGSGSEKGMLLISPLIDCKECGRERRVQARMQRHPYPLIPICVECKAAQDKAAEAPLVALSKALPQP